MSLFRNVRALMAISPKFDAVLKAVKGGNNMTIIPSVIALLAAIGTQFSPEIQGYIGHHPQLAGGLISVLAILNHWLPSPLAGNQENSK